MNHLMEKLEQATEKEILLSITQGIMGWWDVHSVGGLLVGHPSKRHTKLVENVPDFLHDANADYSVLERLREKATQERWLKFKSGLDVVWRDRHDHKIGPTREWRLGVRHYDHTGYMVGDYTRAAYIAVHDYSYYY